MATLLQSAEFWVGVCAGATAWGFMITRIESYLAKRRAHEITMTTMLSTSEVPPYRNPH